MKNPVFKAIAKILFSKIESAYVGYEMDCLISSEFTPAPNFEYLLIELESLLAKYTSSNRQEFMQWIYEVGRKDQNPMGNYGIYYEIATMPELYEGLDLLKFN